MTIINKYGADRAIQAARKRLREAEELLRPVYAGSGDKEVGDEVFNTMTTIRTVDQDLTSMQGRINAGFNF